MINRDILKRISATVGVFLLTVSMCLFLYSYDNKYTAPTPRGAAGFMTLDESDIRGVNFLISGWAVYGDTLLTPDAFVYRIPEPDGYIFIGQHGGFENITGSPHGSVTYRLVIDIPETHKVYALALPEIYSSCRVYVNGEELFSLGETDPLVFRFETGNVIIPFEAGGKIDLIIAVSDYRHFYSGIIHPPALGSPDAVMRMLNIRSYLRLAICTAALVVGVIALLVGFMSKSKGIAVLYGLLCLFFIGYTAYPVTMTLTRGGVFYYAVEMVSFCAMLLVVMLLQEKMPSKVTINNNTVNRHKHILRGIFRTGESPLSLLRPFILCFGGFVCFAALIMPFITPGANLMFMRAYSMLIIVYQWVAAGYITIFAGMAIRHKKPDVTPLFFGMVAFLSTLAMDRILPVYEPILSGWFHELGGFILIMSVGLMTVREIVRQYRESAMTEERVQTILSAGRTHFEEMNEMYDTISILHHDYKYHINTIGTLVHSGDITGIKKYVADLQAKIPEQELSKYCNNAVINALLCSYDKRCEDEKIIFTVNFALPKKKKIDDYELCVLIGNLLENAFTACLTLKTGRYIELTTGLKGNNFGITVKNSFDGNIILKDDELISTKPGGGNGIKSILSILNRHNGDFIHTHDETAFRVLVVVDIMK